LEFEQGWNTRRPSMTEGTWTSPSH
jgi:hypothetical protein